MKDGVNSANRYYLNRFRDAYRQAVIGEDKNTLELTGWCKFAYLALIWTSPHHFTSADLMMGLPVTEDLYSIFSKEKEHEEKEKESQRGAQEQVSLLLQTYMQLLLPDDEKFHGGWALIDCDPRWVKQICVPWYLTMLMPFCTHSPAMSWRNNRCSRVKPQRVYWISPPLLNQ